MSTKILAVDPGFAATGLSVMDKLPNGKWSTVEMKCVRTTPRGKRVGVRVADDDVDRVQRTASEIVALIDKHDVRKMVVELPNGGAQSSRACRAMALASAMMAVIVELKQMQVEWLTPEDTRRACGVPPSVRKGEDVKVIVMREMAKLYPELERIDLKADREHIADALATFEAAKVGNLVRAI